MYVPSPRKVCTVPKKIYIARYLYKVKKKYTSQTVHDPQKVYMVHAKCRLSLQSPYSTYPHSVYDNQKVYTFPTKCVGP